jgi:hypothetical protein
MRRGRVKEREKKNRNEFMRRRKREKMIEFMSTLRRRERDEEI